MASATDTSPPTVAPAPVPQWCRGFSCHGCGSRAYSTLPVELQLLPLPRQVHAGQGDYSGRHGHHWRLHAPEILAKSLGNRIKSAAHFLRHCLDALDQLLFVFWCHALIPPLSNAAFLKKATAALKSLSSQSLVTYPAALAAAKSCGTLRTASITWDWGMSGPQPHHCSMRRQARSELRVVPELNRTASPPGSRRQIGRASCRERV